jgi:hypothetical protein
MSKRITQAYAFKRLDDAWDNALTEAFAKIGQKEATALVKALLGRAESPQGIDAIESTKAVKATTRALIGVDVRRALRAKAKQIKTEEQLEHEVALAREFAETFPTEARKELKKFASSLPRRGGPGRTAKLTEERAKQACKQIAAAIHDGDKTKAALARVSKASLSLWGITISPRTLQKAWNNRAKEGRAKS